MSTFTPSRQVLEPTHSDGRTWWFVRTTLDPKGWGHTTGPFDSWQAAARFAATPVPTHQVG